MAGTLTFAQLTPSASLCYGYLYFQNPTATQLTSLPVYYTAQGETDTLGAGVVTFNYIDPGPINTLTAFGMQLPGIFAIQLNAYARRSTVELQ